MPPNQYYTELPSDESLQDRISEKRKSSGHDGLLFWTCIATLCSTALSALLFLGGFVHDSYPNPEVLRHVGLKPLRRPSTYMNLDKALTHSNHTFPPISNFPQVVHQISSSDRLRKMTEDSKEWQAKFGTIYPDARHIYITDKVSTIIQFRHIDHGMELCSLNSLVPPQDPTADVQRSSIIDVWALPTVGEISRHIHGSWKYAPPRGERVASISFQESESDPEFNLYSFRCPSNEFSTFELACASNSSGCHVDFWQDQRAQPIAGIYLIQRQSA